jgi:hypothetical protein
LDAAGVAEQLAHCERAHTGARQVLLQPVVQGQSAGVA